MTAASDAFALSLQTDPLLTVREVSKAFIDGPAPIRALQEISFAIASGEFVCLLGPSGSGKSTLLRIIGGLIHPDGGGQAFDRFVFAGNIFSLTRIIFGRVVAAPMAD